MRLVAACTKQTLTSSFTSVLLTHSLTFTNIYNLSRINKVKRDIANLSCNIGSRPWSPFNNGRPCLSEDQSKHYHYRGNQQVGLVRL